MRNHERKKWQGAISLSTLLHLVLIGVFLFGFPTMFEQLPEEQNVLTFEILPISEIANVKNENKTEVKESENKKSKLVEQTKSETKPPVKTPELPKEPEIKESKPEEAPKPEPIKEKIEKPVPETPIKKEPAPEKKPVSKVEPKKKPKVTPKKEEDSIDSILKNLEDASEGTEKQGAKSSLGSQGKQHSRGDNYDKNSPLAITERLLIRGQIQKHWRPPVGSVNLKSIKVPLRILLNKDGSVKDVFVENIVCPINSGNTCKLAEESALRAVWQASPIEKLLPKNYDNWKEIKILFDPSALDQ